MISKKIENIKIKDEFIDRAMYAGKVVWQDKSTYINNGGKLEINLDGHDIVTDEDVFVMEFDMYPAPDFSKFIVNAAPSDGSVVERVVGKQNGVVVKIMPLWSEDYMTGHYAPMEDITISFNIGVPKAKIKNLNYRVIKGNGRKRN